MRHFKYVLDYLRPAIRDGATLTAQSYVDELETIYKGKEEECAKQLVIMQAQREKLVERRDQIDKQVEEAVRLNKTIAEQALQLGKLKSEVSRYEKANFELWRENAKLRGQAKRMEEARAAEKQAIFHERYSAGPAAFSRDWYGSQASYRAFTGAPSALDGVEVGIHTALNSLWSPCPSRYEKPNTKTPDHTRRASPNKKWETSYTKRVVDAIANVHNRFATGSVLSAACLQAIELLTDYHSTMHEVYEERDSLKKQHNTALIENSHLHNKSASLTAMLDFAKKQHEAALTSIGPLNQRISDLIKERDVASATVKARIRERLEMVS